jgi:hypothetical protein
MILQFMAHHKNGPNAEWRLEILDGTSDAIAAGLFLAARNGRLNHAKKGIALLETGVAIEYFQDQEGSWVYKIGEQIVALQKLASGD